MPTLQEFPINGVFTSQIKTLYIVALIRAELFVTQVSRPYKY
jgi:hypothetical protein